MKNVKIIEIDDNNNSNIFENVGFEAVSVTTKQGDEALQDALFEQMTDDTSIILDSGGGNDARKVIKMLEDMGESDNFHYLIPVGNSRAQAQNAKDTYDLIGKPDKCIFILNQVHDLEDVQTEFLFFFGNDELGIKPIFTKKVEWLALGYSPAFELAAGVGKTIANLAAIAENLKNENIRKLFYEQSGGDKAEFKRMYSQYKQSLIANEYLSINLPELLKKLKGAQNICLASTKGGVGKSTIGWHLMPLIFNDDE